MADCNFSGKLDTFVSGCFVGILVLLDTFLKGCSITVKKVEFFEVSMHKSAQQYPSF